jgi:hypothetical protein
VQNFLNDPRDVFQNKRRLFHYTAWTDLFYNRDRVCLLRGTDWVFIMVGNFSLQIASIMIYKRVDLY